MATLTVKTRSGTISELRDIELLEIDGVKFGDIVPVSSDNHEHRIRILEEVVAGILEAQPAQPNPSPQEGT